MILFYEKNAIFAADAAKLGGASAIGVNSIALGLHELCQNVHLIQNYI